jgi:hypothetical protein
MAARDDARRIVVALARRVVPLRVAMLHSCAVLWPGAPRASASAHRYGMGPNRLTAHRLMVRGRYIALRKGCCFMIYHMCVDWGCPGLDTLAITCRCCRRFSLLVVSLQATLSVHLSRLAMIRFGIRQSHHRMLEPSEGSRSVGFADEWLP